MIWAALSLITFAGWYRTRARYLGLLRAEPLRQQLAFSERQGATYAVIWLVIIGLIWVVGSFHPAFPPASSAQWADAASLVILIVLPLDLAVEYAQTWRWKRRLRAREATHA